MSSDCFAVWLLRYMREAKEPTVNPATFFQVAIFETFLAMLCIFFFLISTFFLNQSQEDHPTRHFLNHERVPKKNLKREKQMTELSIVLFGAGGVGKSCCAIRFLNDQVYQKFIIIKIILLILFFSSFFIWLSFLIITIQQSKMPLGNK